MNNQSKYVVITGASSGIGYESAKLFASKGYNLIIIARNMENLQKLKKEVTSGNRHIDVVIRQADLTERENLYNIINSRVDKMIDSGLIEEVKSLYDDNIRSKAINTGIGYKELYLYFDGKITYDEAIDLIKKNSRRYAKRQYTFFNNKLDVNWFKTNYEDFSKTIEDVIKFLEGE